MDNVQQEIFNEEVEMIRQWNELISSPNFSVLITKLTDRIKYLEGKINYLSVESAPEKPLQALDKAVQQSIFQAQKKELADLLKHFEWIKRKKLELDRQN